MLEANNGAPRPQFLYRRLGVEEVTGGAYDAHMINQYAGDGIMAAFGAPIAHEDHDQRACAAALDLARGLGALAEDVRGESGLELGVRMGLNSGEVVVGRIGDDLWMGYTAQGHVVGLAARVQQLAPFGSIANINALRQRPPGPWASSP